MTHALKTQSPRVLGFQTGFLLHALRPGASQDLTRSLADAGSTNEFP